MNPPYSKGGLELDFLDKAINISNKIITVQPATWLLTLKQPKRITNQIDKIYCEIETFNGFEYFDAGISGQMGIQYIDNNKKHKLLLNELEYEKCSDVKVYSYDKKLIEIAEILNNFNDFVWNHKKDSDKNKIKENEWCIKIPQIRGHINKTSSKFTEDYFTIISQNHNFLINAKQFGQWKNIKEAKNRNNNQHCICITFNTELELLNFEKYLKTDFVRMFLLLSKTNINQWSNKCLVAVPYFNFSDEHFNKSPKEIDDWLFKKYNISDKIRKHIEEILPDYYHIRKADS